MSCKKCNLSGHYAKTCKTVVNDLSTLGPEKVETGKSIRDIGRAILEKENATFERLPDDLGTIPQKGLWLVNLERKRIAGKISQIKKNGDILWVDVYGGFVESTPQTIKDGNYKFIELEAPHLMFEVVSKNWAGK